MRTTSGRATMELANYRNASYGEDRSVGGAAPSARHRSPTSSQETPAIFFLFFYKRHFFRFKGTPCVSRTIVARCYEFRKTVLCPQKGPRPHCLPVTVYPRQLEGSCMNLTAALRENHMNNYYEFSLRKSWKNEKTPAYIPRGFSTLCFLSAKTQSFTVRILVLYIMCF